MSFSEALTTGILLPMLFCGVGFFFFRKGVNFFITNSNKKRRCLSCTYGTITEISSMRINKRHAYFPTYQYVVGGKTIRVETKFGTTYCQYKRGDQVKVWYDHNNPAYSYIDGYKQDRITAIAAIFAGSMALFSGLFVVFFVWIA